MYKEDNKVNSREIIITDMGSIEPLHKCEHESYEYYKYEVTKRSQVNQCYVAVYKIPPGKANYPYHYHLRNEEGLSTLSRTRAKRHSLKALLCTCSAIPLD